jgi:hypothetical protein
VPLNILPLALRRLSDLHDINKEMQMPSIELDISRTVVRKGMASAHEKLKVH